VWHGMARGKTERAAVCHGRWVFRRWSPAHPLRRRPRCRLPSAMGASWQRGRWLRCPNGSAGGCAARVRWPRRLPGLRLRWAADRSGAAPRRMIRRRFPGPRHRRPGRGFSLHRALARGSIPPEPPTANVADLAPRGPLGGRTERSVPAQTRPAPEIQGPVVRQAPPTDLRGRLASLRPRGSSFPSHDVRVLRMRSRCTARRRPAAVRARRSRRPSTPAAWPGAGWPRAGARRRRGWACRRSAATGPRP